MGHSTEVLKKTKNRIIISSVQLLSSVQSLSCVRLFTTPWIAARQAALSINTVVSNSLQPHGLQHTRPACPSPTSRACSNSCPLSHWCHSTISSSVVPFTSCLQSSPASEYFPMSQFFTSGGQKYWSFSFSISPSNEYSGLVSFRFALLAVQGILKSLLQHHSSNPSTLQCSAFVIV